MTFYCALGSHTSEPGDKQHKVVTKKRSVTYSPYVQATDKLVVDTTMKDPSFGWEIEQEVNACAAHALVNQINVWSPEPRFDR